MGIHRTEIGRRIENQVAGQGVASMVVMVAERGFHTRRCQRIRGVVVEELAADCDRKMSSTWGKRRCDPGVLGG